MKKIFYILFITLLATNAFAQRSQKLFQDYVTTSEGTFFCTMYYEGKNKGQEYANNTNSYDHWISASKVSNGRSEAVSEMLSRYQHSTGDTYSFLLGFIPRGVDRMVDSWRIIVEYTSNTKYVWWPFYDKTGEVWR